MASAALAIAKLQIPYVLVDFSVLAIIHDRLCTMFSINLVVVTPLTENMPGPSATKPGDMYVCVSCKTSQSSGDDV